MLNIIERIVMGLLYFTFGSFLGLAILVIWHLIFLVVTGS